MHNNHIHQAVLTFTDVSGEEGSCHPGLLVVTWTTVITALPTCVVFTFTAKLLQGHETANRWSQASRTDWTHVVHGSFNGSSADWRLMVVQVLHMVTICEQIWTGFIIKQLKDRPYTVWMILIKQRWALIHKHILEKSMFLEKAFWHNSSLIVLMPKLITS